MSTSCLEKQRSIASHFAACPNEEARYTYIIQLGKELPPLNPLYKTPDNIVQGCQSTMYLYSYMQGENLFFNVESNALISAGLAAILLAVYNGETPETILKCPPDYLDTLGINASLSPSRANGLHSIHLRMKQDALKWLLKKGTPL